MLAFKIISTLTSLCIPFIALDTVRIFNLRKFGLKPVDLAFPLFLSEFLMLADTFLFKSMLPIFMLLMSAIAIFAATTLIRSQKGFGYVKFLKVVWRSGFLLIFPMQILLLLLVFLIR